MKTLEALYQEVLASDELKKGLAEAVKTPEGLTQWVKSQGCEATAEEIGAFLKEKQEKAGELTDDELESAVGGCNTNEALMSIVSIGILCLVTRAVSVDDPTWHGENGTLLCHEASDSAPGMIT